MINFRYPKNCTLIHVDHINTEGRARKEFGNLQELADSILQVGLIHPPTLGEGNILLGGERRIRAMQLLGAFEIPVLFREQLSSYEVKEIELHENTRRLKMSWQEKVMLIHDAHMLRQHENALEGKPWYQRDTGMLFGQSQSSVHNALELAKLIMDNDQEILTAPKITDAITILLDRAERVATEEQVRRHGIAVPVPTPQSRGKQEIVVVDSVSGKSVTSVLPGVILPTPAPQIADIEFDLGQMLHLGDCLKIMKKMKAGSVDHVVTDIPYGIDTKQMEVQNKEEIEDTHQVEQNVEMMPEFLKQAYRLIGTKGGYCVFFYDLDHHEKLQNWATEVGFSVTRWPYTWVKTHQCQNNAAQFNPTKCTEQAMICRRGSKTTLIKPWQKNYIMCDASTERKLYSNPFAKPAAVWNDILDHIAFVGQTILDPYAGQFSSGRAMLNKGLKPVLIEISRYHFIRGTQALMDQLKALTNNKAKFINNPLEKDANEGGAV